MKSERLLSMLLLLQTHPQLSATVLAERLEVSVRTVMRDVESLSASGVPIYTVRGPYGGIALLPGYRTDVTGLTADEARALFVLVSGSAHADLGLGSALDSALRKVMAALPAPHRPGADLVSRHVLIDPTRWRGIPRPTPPAELAVVQHAVFADRRLRLRYRRGQDRRVHRYTVDPYGLVNKGGTWYLVADHRRESRLFRADRILAAEILEQPARRREGHDLASEWDRLRRRIEEVPAPLRVRVRVQPETVSLFLRLHEADLAGPPPRADNGAPVELELRLRSVHAGQPLLVFGPAVEVLEPPELRRELARLAVATVAVYAD